MNNKYGLTKDNAYPEDLNILQGKRSRSFGNLSVRGRALESEIYLIIWGENTEYVEQDLFKRLNDLKMKFTNSGYRTEILE